MDKIVMIIIAVALFVNYTVLAITVAHIESTVTRISREIDDIRREHAKEREMDLLNQQLLKLREQSAVTNSEKFKQVFGFESSTAFCPLPDNACAHSFCTEECAYYDWWSQTYKESKNENN